jgi:hypothetical protein
MRKEYGTSPREDEGVAARDTSVTVVRMPRPRVANCGARALFHIVGAGFEERSLMDQLWTMLRRRCWMIVCEELSLIDKLLKKQRCWLVTHQKALHQLEYSVDDGSVVT